MTSPHPLRPLLPWMAGAFAVALAVRGVVLWEVHDAEYYTQLVLDASTYQRIATEGDPQTPYYHPPLYPWFIRGIYALSGAANPDAVRVVQVVLGALSSAMVVLLSSLLGATPKRAGVAGLAMALLGSAVYFDVDLLPASLATLMVLTGLVGLVAPAKRWWPGYAAFGLLSGLCLLLLPSVGLAIAAVLGWAALRHNLRGALLAGGLAAAIVAPVAVRNYQQQPDLVPISYNGGVNFWIGNHPDFPATMNIRQGQRWQKLSEEPFCYGGVQTWAELSAYYNQQGLRYLMDAPVEGAGKLLAKASTTLSGVEIGRNRDIYEVRDESRVMAALLWPGSLPFILVLPAFVVGGLSLVRRRRPAAPVLLACLGILVVGVIFFPTARYRAPALPLMLAVAGAGLAHLRRSDLVLALVSAGITLIPSVAPVIPSSAVPYAIGTDLIWDGHFAQGLPHLQRALEREPDDMDSLVLMGHTLGRMGRYAESLPYLQEAVRIDPTADQAWQYLGIHWSIHRDDAAAAHAFQQAVHANPCNHAARAMLAEVLISLGRIDEARVVVDGAAPFHTDGHPRLDRLRAALAAAPR